MTNGLLRAYILVLAAFEKEVYVPGLHIDFSNKEFKIQLSGLLLVENCEGCWKE